MKSPKDYYIERESELFYTYIDQGFSEEEANRRVMIDMSNGFDDEYNSDVVEYLEEERNYAVYGDGE